MEAYTELAEEVVLPPVDPTSILLPEHFSTPLQKMRYPVRLDFTHPCFKLRSIGLLSKLKDTALQEIDVTGNELTTLADLNRFVVLKSLRASSNYLESGPGVNLNLRSLTRLDMSNNRLVLMPLLQHLPLLQVLNLSHNYMSEGWGQLSHCGALRAVDCSHNPLDWDHESGELSNAMSTIGALKKLRVLDLSNTPVSERRDYRSQIIHSCRRLELLDGTAVVDGIQQLPSERQQSQKQVREGVPKRLNQLPDDEMRTSRSRTSMGSTFGVALEATLALENSAVPHVIQQCTQYVQEHDLHYSTALTNDGDPSLVLALRRAFAVSSDEGVRSLHALAEHHANVDAGICAVCTLLRDFLRELPQPLIPVELFLPLLHLAKECRRAGTASTTCCERVNALLNKMIDSHWLLLKHMLCFLLSVLRPFWENGDFRQRFTNVWAPCILRAPSHVMAQFHGNIVETMGFTILMLLEYLLPGAHPGKATSTKGTCRILIGPKQAHLDDADRGNTAESSDVDAALLIQDASGLADNVLSIDDNNKDGSEGLNHCSPTTHPSNSMRPAAVDESHESTASCHAVRTFNLASHESTTAKEVSLIEWDETNLQIHGDGYASIVQDCVFATPLSSSSSVPIHSLLHGEEEATPSFPSPCANDADRLMPGKQFVGGHYANSDAKPPHKCETQSHQESHASTCQPTSAAQMSPPNLKTTDQLAHHQHHLRAAAPQHRGLQSAPVAVAGTTYSHYHHTSPAAASATGSPCGCAGNADLAASCPCAQIAVDAAMVIETHDADVSRLKHVARRMLRSRSELSCDVEGLQETLSRMEALSVRANQRLQVLSEERGRDWTSDPSRHTTQLSTLAMAAQREKQRRDLAQKSAVAIERQLAKQSLRRDVLSNRCALLSQTRQGATDRLQDVEAMRALRASSASKIGSRKLSAARLVHDNNTKQAVALAECEQTLFKLQNELSRRTSLAAQIVDSDQAVREKSIAGDAWSHQSAMLCHAYFRFSDDSESVTQTQQRVAILEAGRCHADARAFSADFHRETLHQVQISNSRSAERIARNDCMSYSAAQSRHIGT